MGVSRKRLVLIVTWVCLVAGAVHRAEAQTPAEMLAERLKAGDQLTVTAQDLARIRGKLIAVCDDGLVIDTGRGHELVRFDTIEKVSRKRLGVLLGPIIGAGVGIGFAIPVAMLFHNEGADATAASAFLIGLGAGTGLLIDAAINLPRTVYRRQPPPRVQIAPQIGRDRRGVALQVTF